MAGRLKDTNQTFNFLLEHVPKSMTNSRGFHQTIVDKMIS